MDYRYISFQKKAGLQIATGTVFYLHCGSLQFSSMANDAVLHRQVCVGVRQVLQKVRQP